MHTMEDPLKKTKELLKRLEPTQESIVATSDHFLLLSGKGYSEDLCALWQKTFNIASSRQKLSFLYLLNHVVQCDWKDEGRLKRLFAEICEKSFVKAYKLSDDKDIKKEIIRILAIWKDRNIFERDFIAKIESTLQSVGPIERTKKASVAPSGLFEAFKKLVPPKQLVDLGENLRRVSEWDEKIELIKESLQIILSQKIEYNEIETDCKLAEYERAIQQRKKYAGIVQEQVNTLIKAEDNLHLQEVLQIKGIQGLIEEVQRIRERLKEEENVGNNMQQQGQ
eukprot:TRINITY_DN139475_c0_g1_i1.p1 TRINITY_DN139475_c0_g1~~TRINITY_DN139475_c0_g1_i1.p1  ORF type:complete len:281 (-),score=41.79 TRINITY_DN139475_c0_g1_i1:86-928(-)